MRLITFLLLALMCVAALGAGSFLPLRPTAALAGQQRGDDDGPGNNGQGGQEISEHARRQIEGLMREKATRSRGRRKMDSRLIYGIKMHRHEKIADEVDTLEITLPQDERGDTIVDITADIDDQLIEKLKDAGVRILNSLPEYRSIRAGIDLDTLDTIADFPEVRFIQPMQEALTSQEPGDPEHLRTTQAGFDEPNLSQELANAIEEFQQNSYNVPTAGVRKSEADVTHRAALARNTYGFDGTGIKIGVLSDGVRNLAAVQASGDVVPVTVLPGQSGTSAGQCSATASCDEGTAMLEIVHDIAPGAQLFFATAFGGSANFANNIRNLRLAGCDIIVDDVFYFAESPFQDGQAPSVISPTNGGVIAQAVNDVTASGALYFSSAGNSGNKNDGTSGVWEGDFVDGGNAIGPLAGAGRVHTFPEGSNLDVVTLAGSGQYNLNWSDPLGASNNDYDLYALNATGTGIVTASTANQNGTQDPFEAIGVTAANTRLVIVRFSGVGRYLRLTTNRGRLNVNTPGQTTGHSCGADAFGVAATSALAQFPNAFTAANQVETFSSDGPRKLFYQANGTPFTPGNVSSTGGISRQKPDITAADGVSVTGAGGFGIQFFGTSAAAPHAGAIAALLKSSNPLLTNGQIRNALQSTAIDNEAAGVDRDSGYGIIMPDSALAFLGTPGGAANVTLGTTIVSEVGGNANGFIEPGERGTFNVPLVNPGVGAATSVSATLSSSTPGIVITPSASRAYSNIPASGGTSSSATPFEFVYQEGATYAAVIDFVVTVNYNGVNRTYPVKVPTGVLANISTTLDAIPPASGPGFTATTGLQLSRMAFTFPINNCGAPKANPGAFASLLNRTYDAYTFTNTSASTICVTALLTHSATALLYVDAYVPTFNPASVATNFAGDNGGSTGSGAGTTQLFSFNVNAGQTYTVVVSETNSGGAQNVPYNLRITGLPAAPVPANQAPVNAVPGTQTVLEDQTLTFSGGNGNQISISDADAGNNTVQVSLS
ncbi:MAG TPA: S8 family serine peptidase, partial [Candidatus Binatia bacterium]|nr:S8 family serine peptidase [Candidatus Binatia bacterium]